VYNTKRQQVLSATLFCSNG